MKRVLCLFLAMVILSVIPVSALGYNTEFVDVDISDYYAEAAKELKERGILTGYSDGTFGAENKITRAEMATIICKMMNKVDEAENYADMQYFGDVKPSHWANGYINFAVMNGIVNGDGNGKFRPEDAVKVEEAVKMIICALGFEEDVIRYDNDWSKGCMDVAREKGILLSVKGKKGEAATRGDVAVMVYEGICKKLYKLTVTTPIYGSINISSGEYSPGEKIELIATPDDGFTFFGWISIDTGLAAFDDVYYYRCVFTMPDHDAEIGAAFVASKTAAGKNSNVSKKYYEGTVVPKYESVTNSPQVATPLTFAGNNAKTTRYFYDSTWDEVDEYIGYLEEKGWTYSGVTYGGDSRGQSEITTYSHQDSNGNDDAYVQIHFFEKTKEVDIVVIVEDKD